MHIKLTMTFKYIQLLGAATMMMVSASAFSQCSSCTPDYTCVADGFPVLCPDVLPDGTTGEEYLATATFNMPGSVVDPGSGITATLESITITSITGLPFGLIIDAQQSKRSLLSFKRRRLRLRYNMWSSSCSW